MDYQFRALGKTCAGTGRELRPGEPVHSVVVERQGELVRLDFSDDGWKGTPTDTVGEWTSRFPDSHHKQPVLDTESLFRYFEQLCEDPNPAHDQFRYVLALTLLQKRRLRLEGSRSDEDGAEYLQVIGNKSEGPFEIRDQQLSEAEIAELQQAVTKHITAEAAA